LWEIALIAFISFQIVINTWKQIHLFLGYPFLFSSQSYPGKDFLGLRSYLKSIPMAGYYSDWPSSHPLTDAHTMFAYQQAQYALSPTLLDYYHPFTYKWIVLNCHDHRTEERLLKELNVSIVVRLPNGLAIGHREKP